MAPCLGPSCFCGLPLLWSRDLLPATTGGPAALYLNYYRSYNLPTCAYTLQHAYTYTHSERFGTKYCQEEDEPQRKHQHPQVDITMKRSTWGTTENHRNNDGMKKARSAETRGKVKWQPQRNWPPAYSCLILFSFELYRKVTLGNSFLPRLCCHFHKSLQPIS